MYRKLPGSLTHGAPELFQDNRVEASHWSISSYSFIFLSGFSIYLLGANPRPKQKDHCDEVNIYIYIVLPVGAQKEHRRRAHGRSCPLGCSFSVGKPAPRRSCRSRIVDGEVPPPIVDPTSPIVRRNWLASAGELKGKYYPWGLRIARPPRQIIICGSAVR